MSDTSTGDPGKPMKQPSDDLSKVMGQLSVTTNDSDKASTQSKNLSDMPFDVVGLIIDRSEYKQQLILRKVSKTFRALVDKQNPACTAIRVVFSLVVSIHLDSQIVTYTSPQYYYEDDDDSDIVKLVGDDFKEVAFDDLASTLKNPKLQLEEFSVVYCFRETKRLEENNKDLQNVLKSLNHQVSVKKVKLSVSYPSCILSILPYLKPGVLEKISLNINIGMYKSGDSTGMDQVARLEQWKQAEELELGKAFDEFPMEYATHFKRFVTLEGRINGDKISRIKDYINKLEHFEQYTFRCMTLFYERDLVQQLLGSPVSSNATEEVFHHPIPDSDFYFELKTFDEKVQIRKKKRGSH